MKILLFYNKIGAASQISSARGCKYESQFGIFDCCDRI